MVGQAGSGIRAGEEHMLHFEILVTKCGNHSEKFLYPSMSVNTYNLVGFERRISKNSLLTNYLAIFSFFFNKRFE